MKELIGINKNRITKKGKEQIARNGEEVTLAVKKRPTEVFTVNSVFEGTFTNKNEVILENDYCKRITIGETTEAYDELKKKLHSGVSSFEEIMQAVYSVVDSYFEFTLVSNEYNSRKYKENEEMFSVKKLSDLKHRGIAKSTEKAMLVQNLLHSLEIPSFYKAAMCKSGKFEIPYAYNVVTCYGKHYIFDAASPKLEDGVVTPLITEISDEVYEEMKKNFSENGYAITIDTLDKNGEPLERIYDSVNNNEIILDEEKTTKKI